MSAATSTIAPVHTAAVHSPKFEPEVVDSEPEREVVEQRESQLGHSQCMQALARANEVRLARAALKRDVCAGRRNVTEVVIERPWEAESMSLLELLGSQRRWGRQRSRKLLTSLGLTETKRLGTLTERQQRVLVTALNAKLCAPQAT
jgi:hypothetical protein